MMEILSKLKKAENNKDADEVEDAINSAYKSGLLPEYGPVFIRLLDCAWHYRHEDLVSALQQLKDPNAIDVIFRTAKKQYKYLEYDEFFGLARKCTWALADIGTEAARSKLKASAGSRNSIIAGYAQKRLDRWEEETKRKDA